MDPEVASEVPEDCLPTTNENTHLKLRVAGIFIILATSAIGTLFPIFAKRSKHVHVPKKVFEFAKFFGSGIIIATAFIHLLAPAFETLGSECLTGAWGDYPWAPAIAMISIFLLFFVEFFSFRWGTAKLEAAGFAGAYDQHGHNHEGNHAGHGPEPISHPSTSTQGEHHHHLTHSHSHTHSHPPSQFPPQSNDIVEVTELPIESNSPGALTDVKKEQLPSPNESTTTISGDDDEAEWGGKSDWMKGDAISQILVSNSEQLRGIAILEFGVVFHSFFIGLTLATDPQFIILFIVIIFHQTFEGLGLGSRLAFLPLPRSYNWVPVTAGTAYAFVTPVGMAIGLGVRHSYQGNSVTALVTSGVLDSISAGILLWTGLVELLAHEFLFSEEMQKASNGKVFYAMSCMMLGAGLMALLGRWA
ncbi:Zinc/iron permease [Mrakia frigida]|uniref:Zinc/iron permease n=1 Tax=Mrakia frigida TaxID=29902 RepID=UPI003FCC1308